MTWPYDFFEGVDRFKPVQRVALWDLDAAQDPSPRSRMLEWLDDTILEQHFADMRRRGVELVRVPCGYWNWVTYSGDDGPVAVADCEGVPVAQRLKNLHRIATPEDYQVYFDRLFEFARSNGIKVLLDLHGLPGSQNGEIHSGACLEITENRTTYFEAEANKEMAVKAVQAMAKYARDKGSTLFGIQVINEPHLQSADNGHAFLRDYYRRAILAAREFLDASVPIVLFEWTYRTENWEDNAFPESDFGAVLWDMHLYQFPKNDDKWTTHAEVRKAYKWDLEQLRHFSNAQGGRVFVGEFTLAGPSLGREETAELARWFVDQFAFATSGFLLWAYDCQLTGWSMQRQGQHWELDWRRIARVAQDATRAGMPIYIEAAGAGVWLGAQKDGSVRAGARDPSWWEEWVPHYRRDGGGEQKVSFRSAAHGTWLSVNEHGHARQAEACDAWEEFIMVAAPPEELGRDERRLALRSCHGTWLMFEADDGHVTAVHGGDADSVFGTVATWILSPVDA